jgi:pyridoxamine 5'-phosphate oxidase
VPDAIEVWYDRPHRLHERHVYHRDGHEWRHEMLSP